MQRLEPINWNRVIDPVDKDVWDKLTSNFWLPEKVPVSNDIPKWNKMTEDEQVTLARIFAGLTLLDTIQGTVGAQRMLEDALTPHEEAVLTNQSFMESVHAKSYSTIFSTLMTTPEIDDAFEWSASNPYMQYKANRILDFYEEDDPIKKKIASVLLESFLFFSGFYYIFHLASKGILTNSATIIQLILRDESVHGYYLGYKAQKDQDALNLSQEERDKYADDTYELVFDLMDNEALYMHDLYDSLGLTSEAQAYTKYNCNKALMNLGYEPLFPKEEATPPAEIMAFMDPTGNQNHDFFSDSGSSYVIIDTEETTDSDWEF
jgi:ribonucleoside-diphosphate reductase beta chain